MFDFIQSGLSSEEVGLDRAILAALYDNDNMDLSKRKAQMRLALAWNRVDYARDEILDTNNLDYKDVSFITRCQMLFTAGLEPRAYR